MKDSYSTSEKVDLGRLEKEIWNPGSNCEEWKCPNN